MYSVFNLYKVRLIFSLFPLHPLLAVCLCVQMFKGFDKAKDIQYVYTPVFSSLCGVKLDSNNKAGYLLSGTVRNVFILHFSAGKINRKFDTFGYTVGLLAFLLRVTQED